MFIFLSSGLFCCLGFSFFFFLFGRGRVFFAVWAGAQAPPKQQKKSHLPKQQKNEHAPAPSERFFFAVWADGRVFFCCLGGGRDFFCCLGGVRVFFCCLGGGRVLVFAV